MLLLRGSKQCREISFLGDCFSAVDIGRKLYVIVIFCVGSAYVVWYHIVLMCGRKYLLLVLYIMLVGQS